MKTYKKYVVFSSQQYISELINHNEEVTLIHKKDC